MGEPLAMLPPDRSHIANLPAADARPDICKVREHAPDRSGGLGIGDGGTEGEARVVLGDLLQLLQMADEDRRGDVAHLLGDPEADIGRAGNDGRLGHVGAQFGKILKIGRQEGAGAVAFHLDAGAAERPELCCHRLAAGHQNIFGRVAEGAGGLCGVDDGLVAGAAAEIALQRRLNLRFAGFRHGEPEGVKRHDDARGAEAALAGVFRHHRLLHRVEAVGAGEVLHRHHMAAVDGGKEPDAGIDRLVGEALCRQAADQHRAGAAIALRAALLGAGEAAGKADVVEQGVVRADFAETDLVVIEKEADVAANGGHWRAAPAPFRQPPSRAMCILSLFRMQPNVVQRLCFWQVHILSRRTTAAKAACAPVRRDAHSAFVPAAPAAVFF